MASWLGWNAGPPQPVVYPELPTPVSVQDFERLAEECFTQLMQLEAEGPEAGWTRIDFQVQPDLPSFIIILLFLI